MKRLMTAAGCAALLACGSSNDPVDPVRRDMGGGPDSGTDAGGSGPGAPEFLCEVVDGLGADLEVAGDFARIAVDGARVTAAYGYIDASATRTIRFAERNAPGDWATESIVDPARDEPGSGDPLDGLGFDFVDGVPTVVFFGGDDDAPPPDPYQGVSDLMAAERAPGGSWSVRTLVEASNEAEGTCADGTGYCDRGTVVGREPDMVARPAGGMAILYRDNHFGFGSDDFRRADAEILVEGPGGYHRIADVERSGALSGAITVMDDGRVAAAYYINQVDPESDRGVWLAVEDGDGFSLSQISGATTSQRVSIASRGNAIFVAFYDADDQDLVVASTFDDGGAWSIDIVDEAGITGQYPSIAIDDSDRPVVAYTYCNTSARGCSDLGGNAEVRLARLEGSDWAIYPVDDGQGQGGVGAFNDLVVLSDGRLGVVFQDVRNNDLIYAEEQP